MITTSMITTSPCCAHSVVVEHPTQRAAAGTDEAGPERALDRSVVHTRTLPDVLAAVYASTTRIEVLSTYALHLYRRPGHARTHTDGVAPCAI
jgi:hypothetical protein